MSTMATDDFTGADLLKDGISEEFFRLMWLKDEMNFGPSLNIPDSIVMKYGQPTSWYFTANNGKIRKKNRQNLMNARIEEVFTKHILGYDILATFVNVFVDPDPDTGVVPPSVVEFLDRDGLNQFLYNRPKETSNGILQRFIEPKGTKNELIRAIWSPKVVLLERAANIHHLHDHRYGLYERCVTLEGPEYYITSAPLRGPVLAGQIQKLCESIVTHISEVTFAQKEITRLVLNFKVDSRDKIWLLYTTSIRLNDMLENTVGGSSLVNSPAKIRRNLVNIDSAVQLPNTINLNPSRSYDKIVAKQRIKCISCAKETLDDMRHPVTYKSVIKHYEHVLHIMTEICANQHTTVLDWPPDPDIVEAAGGIGFGCLEMVSDDDVLLKNSKLHLNRPLEADELRIPPILRYLHPKLSGTAYFKCRKDPLFLYKTCTVCEPCFLVFAEFTTMLLRMGGDLSKLLTPDPAAVNSLNSMGGSMSTAGSMTNGTRPSSADWRAMSTVTRSQSMGSMKNSKEFNPSANHRQAKQTAIGLRSGDGRRAPNMPRTIRKPKDVGPLVGGGGSSQLNQSLGRSSSMNQMNASQTSIANGTSFVETDDISQMVEERERNFFKEISQNPQLKDQHPLMHLISAQQKLKLVDEMSGTLMSKAASKKESIFGTSYGKQGPDKYEKYGIYKVEQPYIMKGEIIKPSTYLKIKNEEKEARLFAKAERIRRKKDRVASMKANMTANEGELKEVVVGMGVHGGMDLLANEETSVKDITNTKSAKKHRDFLRDVLADVEHEIIDSSAYFVMPTKEEIIEQRNQGTFDALDTNKIKSTVKKEEMVARGLDRTHPQVTTTTTTPNDLSRTLELSGQSGSKAVGFADNAVMGDIFAPNSSTDGMPPRSAASAGRPGTTSSVGGRAPRSALKSGGAPGSPGGFPDMQSGIAQEDMFSLQSSSIELGENSTESALLGQWGVEKPLKAEAPSGLGSIDADARNAAEHGRRMIELKNR